MKTCCIYLISIISLFGCSSQKIKNPNSAQGAYQEAENFYKSGRYDEAILKLKELKNKNPHTNWALKAELKIADIYFEREDFLEAQHSFLIFKEFHPKHSKIDHVTFQLAMSYFKQLPGTADRDMSSSQKALLHFNEVIQSFPDSSYTEKAKEKKSQILIKLASKELYIANFYFKQKKWPSAFKRYDNLIKRYPRLGFDAKSLKGCSLSAAYMGEKPTALRFWNQLKTRFPKNSETRSTKSKLENHGIL